MTHDDLVARLRHGHFEADQEDTSVHPQGGGYCPYCYDASRGVINGWPCPNVEAAAALTPACRATGEHRMVAPVYVKRGVAYLEDGSHDVRRVRCADCHQTAAEVGHD